MSTSTTAGPARVVSLETVPLADEAMTSSSPVSKKTLAIKITKTYRSG